MKMSRYKHLSGFILMYFVRIVYGDDFLSKHDECADICADNFLVLPVIKEANNICQRGCRIFNLIDGKADLNINKSKNDCFSSCVEAYASIDTKAACKIGCQEMHKKRESELSKGFLLYIEQDGQNNLMVVQPEVEQFDFDILADPVLRNQLNIGYNMEYKIPETHIRTMPINSDTDDDFGIPPDMTLKRYQPTGDWLDCASRNSGIPRWMLVSAILLAVLLGIWLIFASEKREQSDLTDSENLVCHIDNFPVPPPKYSLESEKV